jgi:hypothetical protein
MRKLILLSSVTGLLALSALAVQGIVLYPNETRYVSSPAWVTCSAQGGGFGQALQMCDCRAYQSASNAGIAIGTTGQDLHAQCKAISSNSAPFDCKKVTLSPYDQALCDCRAYESASTAGEAFGTNGRDIAEQCRAVSSNSSPFNCRTLSLNFNDSVMCDCRAYQSASNAGLALGMDGKDLAAQCRAISSNTVPFNCRAQ